MPSVARYWVTSACVVSVRCSAGIFTVAMTCLAFVPSPRTGIRGSPRAASPPPGRGPTGAHDRQVQRRLRGWTSRPAEHTAFLVDLDDLIGFQQSFIYTARRDRDCERRSSNHGTEVAASAERPAARITEPADLGQLFSDGVERHAQPPPRSTNLDRP